MNSRERTFLTLAHETGDRIPIDSWASRAMIHKLEVSHDLVYEQFLDLYGVDLRYIPGSEHAGLPLTDGRDIWGVKRTVADVEATTAPIDAWLAGLRLAEERSS